MVGKNETKKGCATKGADQESSNPNLNYSLQGRKMKTKKWQRKAHGIKMRGEKEQLLFHSRGMRQKGELVRFFK